MGIFGIHTCMHGLLQALMMESFKDGKPFLGHDGRVVLYIVYRQQIRFTALGR